MSEQGTSKEWMRRWTDLQLAQESTQSIAATTLVCELVAEVERLSRAGEPAAERALRNCLLLAMSRLHRRSVSGVEKLDWEHILRFCKEGGVEPSPLRATQPPVDVRAVDCPACGKPMSEHRGELKPGAVLWCP